VDRHNFGVWGAELGADDFARAIAAAGTIGWYLAPGLGAAQALRGAVERARAETGAGTGRRELAAVDWYGPPPRPERPGLFGPATDMSAAALAAAWRDLMFEGGAPLRCRVVSEDLDPVYNEWVFDQLAREAVGTASVFQDVPDFARSAAWHWPLRITLPDDRRSRAWRDRLGDRSWIPLLTSARALGAEAGERSELLLLPGDVRDALATLTARRNRARASCVVVLGGFAGSDAPGQPILDTLRAETGALGVAVLRLPEPAQRRWLDALVESLAHDQPLDVALFAAARSAGVAPPRLQFDRRLLERARLSFEARTLARRLELFPPAEPVALSERAAGHLGLPYGRTEVAPWEAAGALLTQAPGFAYDYESEEASTVAELARTAAAAPKSMLAVPSRLRHLRAVILRGEGEPSVVVDERWLLPESAYAVDVSIGYPGPGGAVALDRPFPPLPGVEDHLLACVFSEPSLVPQPQLGGIVLPAEGDSTSCRFYFRTRGSGTRVDARILVAFENRVIETARLRAAVWDGRGDAPGETADAERGIDLVPEAYIGTDLAHPEEWVRYDAALHFNHDDRGEGRVLSIADDWVAEVRLPATPEPVKRIVSRLSDVAWSPTKYGELTSEDTEALLRYLAFQGNALYELLMSTPRAREHLERAGRIQVVTAREDALFPLELAYDDPAPVPEARLCPHAGRALAAASRRTERGREPGGCTDGCPSGQDRETVVCPLAFWGLDRVIERQADATLKADVGVRATPSPGADRLDIVGPALLAAHERVDAEVTGCTDMVRDALARVSAGGVNLAGSWAEWRAHVSSDAPTVLVLLPHCRKHADVDRPLLEIGTDDQLVINNVNRTHVSGNDERSPIVLLIGCRTSVGDGELQTFPVKFLRNGAALVVGTVATVLGRHAGPVTARLLTALDRMATANGGAGARFGDALLEAKRELVAEGYPMALALTAHGDARWVLVKGAA
jgi:hypothetical protein